MDNHPIPQDVTNFQFRLIGEMTLKQFGYVAGGVVFAWIVLASPLPFLLKIIFAGLCVLAGVILAFVPFEGRPADVMILYFIKALFSPTQFVYQKFMQNSTPQQKTFTPPAPKKEEKKNEKKVTIAATPFMGSQAVAQTQSLPTPEPMKESLKPTQPTPVQATQDDVLKQQVTLLTEELAQAKTEEAHQQTGSLAEAAAHEKVIDLEQQMQTIAKQKQDLEKQLFDLQKTLAEKKQQVFTPATAQEPVQQTQHVKKIPKQMGASVGTPLVPDVPNLITGVIKDPRGNVLQNILIEIKDKDGNPVRAFKTNPLGQFAAATPLTNGIYTISFEDPQAKHSFDTVEITANGEILLPLEIISIDARERLRQELFGSNKSA